ncbi:redoxin domain-containing protein [Nocardioides daeguensis]|uniref:Thioredoxin domain-containing protein n=2 Tax=Nocardioides daeguensis TaxID=908359 RepID=A0ABP6VLC0_9ACTN|nr:redoxin domain-containing protein [Nocardioides daeguensis]MCR1773520.1 redoxin domain-containing protein [Nocardioides daeguensis]
MSTAPATASVPLDLVLTTPEATSVALGDLLTHRLTVVQLVRYFGCLPCQEWLLELDASAPGLADDGVGAIAVGGSADYQAIWLRDERGAALPLLLDPEHRLRDHVGATAPLGWRMADPRGAAAYARSLAKGLRPQRVTRDSVRSPGVVVLDRAGRVRWQHIGTRIGDYPPLDEVRAAVAALLPDTDAH